MTDPGVLFVSEGYGKQFFGVAQVLMRLVSCCRRHSMSYWVLVARAADIPLEDQGRVERIPTLSLTRNMRWHPRQQYFLQERIAEFSPDVVHIHGVLTFIQLDAIRAARRAGVPVLLSPHGMLEPWMWRQKGALYYWFKRLYWRLVMRPILQRADYVHAITPQESETLRREFPTIPLIRIPNSIEIAEYVEGQAAPDAERYLLFLGRLHPVKGVDLLIEAFARANTDGFRLIIAGPDSDAGFTRTLQSMVGALGLSERVTFAGPAYGEAKHALLKGAWCTIAPSHSEVMAMVNLESAASFTPTITTTMTGLGDWEEGGGGLLVEPEVDAIRAAIEEACRWAPQERMRRGKRARDFVAQRYSWEVIGPQWIDAYRAIASAGTRHG